jgi:Na+/melibiose symporter-like transporter
MKILNDNKVNTSQATLNPLTMKLSVVEKIGFGLGDTASNILYQAWNFFLMIFYTYVFGIDTKVAASCS